MNSILYSVFVSLTLRMTVITLVILLIKRVFKSKLSAKTHCCIWMIVALQFVFCIGRVSIPTSASVYNVIPDITQTSAAETAVAAANIFDIKNIVTAVWLLGSIILAVWYVSVFIVYKNKIKQYEIITDEGIVRSLEIVKSTLDITSFERIEMRCGDTAQTLAHTVILPPGYSDREIHQILLHEMCHYKHKDYVKLCFGLAVLCVNWFNPLIWLAFKIFRTDIEMLCDDRVLKLTESKKEYAQVLVKSATVRSHFIPGAASVHNGKNEVISRVKRIVTLKRHRPGWLVVVTCLCVTASCLCLTDAVSVAVENNVDIVSTPAPIKPAQIPKATETPIVDAPELETTSYAENYYEPEIETQSETQSEPQAYTEYTEPVYSEPEYYDEPAYDEVPIEEQIEVIEEPYVPDVEIGADRNDVYSSLGEPESVSSGGSKEVYQLEDGSTAILQYNGDTLEQGYIVD